MAAIKVCFVLGSLFIVQCLSSDTHHPVGAKGKCPEIQAHKDFNLQRMLGKWYSIEETGKEVSCVFNHIQEAHPGHYQGHIYPANVTVDLSLVNPENIDEGYVLSATNFPPLDKAMLKVVATDYESYAVVFICKEFEDIAYPLSEIWSRSNELSEEQLVEARAVLERAFDADHKPVLMKVNHESCSYETL